MSDTRTHYLKTLGIDLWKSRTPEKEQPVDIEIKVASPSSNINEMDWLSLADTVSHCKSCKLHSVRNRTVFGAGNLQADCLIVTEAPSEEDERQNLPFSGESGQLLDLMLKACGLSRETVYITSLIKCHTPESRQPASKEVHACEPFLEQQIKLLNPKVILVVGGFAAQKLLHTSEKIGVLRALQDHVLPTTDIPVIVTYHPGYLLKSPSKKEKSWNDLKKLTGMLS